MTLRTGVMADGNSALHYRNKLYFKVCKKKKICIFDQINAALMSIRDFFKKHYKFY